MSGKPEESKRISRRQALKYGAAAVAVAAAAAGGVYYYSNTVSPSASKGILLGAVLPLSGSLADIGLSCQRGHDLAVEDINAAGGIKSLGGANIRMVYGDVKSDPTVAATETERIITTYNPVAMFGAYSSALTLVATSVSEKHQVPFLAIMAQVDQLTNQGYKYVFRQAIRSSLTGARAVDMTVDMNKQFGTPIKNVALVWDNVAIGQSISTSAKNRIGDVGYNVVFNEPFAENQQDFSPLVTRLKATQPEIIFILAYLSDAILLANTFHDFKLNAKGFIGMAGAGFLEPNFIKNAGKNSEYFMGGAGWVRDMNIPGLADVVKRFESKYPQFMNEHAGLSYAGTWLMKEAIELSHTLHPSSTLDPDSLRDAFLMLDISSGPAVMTAANRAKFNEKGDNIYGTQLYLQILNAAQHTVWPFNIASTKAAWPAPPWDQRS